MESTATPLAKQTISTAHMNPPRPRPVSRRPVLHPVARQSNAHDTRQRVGQAFRDMAHGITAPLAEAQTSAFYRSGGQEWARTLSQPSGHDLKARVIDAFREMAHGAQDTAAHARTLHFYRSSGQGWAQNLG
jgi:hypothetical protein